MEMIPAPAAPAKPTAPGAAGTESCRARALLGPAGPVRNGNRKPPRGPAGMEQCPPARVPEVGGGCGRGDRMDQAQRERLESIVGHVFADASLPELALRHASMSESRVASNERLEFLGDAVLGLVACERIYQLYPHLLEGEMTKIKSTVVSRQTCAAIGDGLGLPDLLELGKGMKSGALPHSLSAAALEAMVAAIYLDAGLERARRFLIPLLDPRIAEAAASGHQENYKSILQHHAQSELGGAPVYVVTCESGPDHSKLFEISVRVGERRFAAGRGASKKQAEQHAAMLALAEMGVLAIDPAGKPRLIRRNGRAGEGESAHAEEPGGAA
ncbi:MAG: ribonuclease III [Planctomyces sp.]|nr:ribonuclease III [Planctomyces sp.]MBA4120331.1 ribonuclease III [Isosphaera sp.]